MNWVRCSSRVRRDALNAGLGVLGTPIAPICSMSKLTQVQFGEIFGMTSKKVSAWEHGKAEPTEEQKQKIQSLLKESNEQERETR